MATSKQSKEKHEMNGDDNQSQKCQDAKTSDSTKCCNDPVPESPSFRRLVRSTFAGRLLLIPYRFSKALNITLKPVFHALTWTFKSREHYNFTYNLQDRNLIHLASMISVVTNEKVETIRGYLDEIGNDEQLRQHIRRHTRLSPERHTADLEVRYGRRMGWYALVRAVKPRVVVETGVDKGLGSVTIASALMKNAQEGIQGRLIGLDINPKAGYLIREPYTTFAELVIGDSIKTLGELSGEIDMLIHDSNHDAQFEAREYEAAMPKFSRQAIVLSDNAEYTDELFKFAGRTGRRFLFFSEKPKHHWWPGEGIGIAY